MEFTQTVGLEMAFGKHLDRDWDLHPYPSPIKAAKRWGKDPPLTTDTEVLIYSSKDYNTFWRKTRASLSEVNTKGCSEFE